MTSIHGKSNLARLLHAVTGETLGSARRPHQVANFLRSYLQYPIRYVAEKSINAVPLVSFSEFFDVKIPATVNLAPQDLDRSAWNVRLDEEILIGLAVEHLNARQIFEFGTFNGQSTRRMAESASPKAHVFTLDIPRAEVDALNSDYFKGSQIGEKFHGCPVEERITQLFGNSMTFDFSAYHGQMDFIFVDAAHDYIHGFADTRTAIRLVRPGGVIFWHDFVPQWSGLVHGIKEAAQGYPLVRIGGTSFAALRAPSSTPEINKADSLTVQPAFSPSNRAAEKVPAAGK